jgi:acetyl-CoA acetyltransferase
MGSRAFVAGVGMTAFVKPAEGALYSDLGAAAAAQAVQDAGIHYADVQQAYAGYVYGDSTCGQAALYRIGLTGIPVVNVNNMCATGSTALFLARQAVASGAVDCALALGFEQMGPGALGSFYRDRPDPLTRFTEVADDAPGAKALPTAIKLFGTASVEYQERYGIKAESFAKVAEKARRHAEHNERAVFRSPVTIEEILASPQMYGPLTRLQCCPPTCGAAAAVVVSEEFGKRKGLKMNVAIRGQIMSSDRPSTFEDRSMINVVGYELAATTASRLYDETGIGPGDVDVVELHDCFTTNEMMTYEALGLTAPGTVERFIWDEENTYGGAVVTNPSGGLLSKGHPLGATGLAQCAELVWQLRGEAGARQVEGARLGLQHNLGTGSACVMTLYERC